MAADKDGFPVPVIDEARCIDCGLCLKACPVNEPSSDNSSEPECYAVMGSDELFQFGKVGDDPADAKEFQFLRLFVCHYSVTSSMPLWAS